MNHIYKIEWTETERGYGQKPFRDTYHLTREDAQAAINDHWRETQEENKDVTGVPDWYVYPGPILQVQATKETLDKIQDRA